MDNNQHLKTLYAKLLSSTINKDELLWLQEYFKEANGKSFRELIADTLALTEERVDVTPEEQKLLAGVYNRIAAHRFEQPVRKVYKLWPRIAVAASLLLVAGVALFGPPAVILNLFQDPNALAMKNDIAPGHNGATLSFTNGKVINLSSKKTGLMVDGDKLVYSDGAEVPDQVRNDDQVDEALTATTAKGQTYTFTLQDGTKVWLNADSKLEFLSNYKGKAQRRVKLTGEGYFEVAKDKKHPFVVESNGQQVEVLGTHFNVNAYGDEPDTKTTLLEGSVQVAAAGKGKVTLKPAQQAIFDKTFNVKIETLLNAESAIAWTDAKGKPTLIFTNEELPSLMRKVARWYDVEVIDKRTKKRDTRFTGMVMRDRNLSSVITLLEATGSVHLKIEGRKLIVMD